MTIFLLFWLVVRQTAQLEAALQTNLFFFSFSLSFLCRNLKGLSAKASF